MTLPAIFGSVAMAMVAAATPAVATYEFPIDPSAVGADGHPLYVGDAAIATAIPGYAQLGARIGSCMSGMTIPRMLYVAYQPTVTGAHTALSNTLECEQSEDRETLACRPHMAASSVVFDVDAVHYFALGAGTDLENALEVYRAYRDGRIAFADPEQPHFKTLPVRQISTEGELFLIEIGDCGCSETLEVVRQRDGDRPDFSGRTRSAICT